VPAGDTRTETGKRKYQQQQYQAQSIKRNK